MQNKKRRKVVIIGATSGIGRELALLYLTNNNTVGITGRRTEELRSLADLYPGKVFYRTMDVQKKKSIEILDDLIREMGGMDLIIFCAGVGTQNPELTPSIEMEAVYTNVIGYAQIAIFSYNYFKKQKKGHIVDISSLAGIRSLRQSPAYSATKRFQIHYTSCLAQKANREKLPISFTTIVPGFIRTPMLKYQYPFSISLQKGAKLIYSKIEKQRRYSTVPGRWRWVEMIWRLIPNYIWEKVW